MTALSTMFPAATGKDFKFQEFTSSGTFTPSSALLAAGGNVIVELGAGGGSGGKGSSSTNFGGGGAAGEIIVVPYVVSGNTPVVIGAGGAAQTTSYTNGNAGSDSSFGSLVATGGYGGLHATGVGALVPPSKYGTFHGAFNIGGGPGEPGRRRGGRPQSVYFAGTANAPANSSSGGGGSSSAVDSSAGGSGYCIVYWWE